MFFEPVSLTDEEEAQRAAIREFLADEVRRGHFSPKLGGNPGHSAQFSARLAEHGWVGMAIPTRYGGTGRTAVDRFIIAEELLAVGAPIAAHWMADRQVAPGLLAFGTEEQRQRLLPAIASGQCFFSLCLSEPDAGSDLASVRCAAGRVDGGWALSGTKIWTTHAHLNHYAITLVRTSPRGPDRHEGLSELMVDLRAPGVQVNPIRFLDGSHDFNEVVFDHVFVPDDMVLGEIGRGWQQVTSDLSFERGGPDRYMSSWQLLEAFLAAELDSTSTAFEHVGRLAARCWVIRHLSLSIARGFDEGRPASVEAALAKDLGTTFEQEVVDTLSRLADVEPDPSSPHTFQALLAQALLIAPSFTIRGGTTEVLRSLAARSLRAGS
jgi:alkylation response protein AidB-like acyl-CoA dehydrogenase